MTVSLISSKQLQKHTHINNQNHTHSLVLVCECDSGFSVQVKHNVGHEVEKAEGGEALHAGFQSSSPSSSPAISCYSIYCKRLKDHISGLTCLFCLFTTNQMNFAFYLIRSWTILICFWFLDAFFQVCNGFHLFIYNMIIWTQILLLCKSITVNIKSAFIFVKVTSSLLDNAVLFQIDLNEKSSLLNATLSLFYHTE